MTTTSGPAFNVDNGVCKPLEFIACGVLGREGDAVHVEDAGGFVTLQAPVWSGYLTHWLGRRVRVARLAQRDYQTGVRILLLSPDEPAPPPPYVVLYYNERLPDYLSSLFGHLAINVDGRVFSFSGDLNENEEMSPEEFLYRPALGEFACDPTTLTSNLSDPDRPYYEKFGRRFMRTVHALRIEGLDTARLAERLRAELAAIHRTPPNPRRPHLYRDFDPLRRNCATIIRDALREVGLSEISGIIPREIFLNVAYHATRPDRPDKLAARASLLDQLKVPERAYSRPNPILNPVNRLRMRRLKAIPGVAAILTR